MEDKIITYRQREFWDIASGVRMCINRIAEHGLDPYSLFLPEDNYWRYIARYKNEVMKFMNVSYMGFRHAHKDMYLHATTKGRAEKIISEGVLRVSGSNEDNTLGKAVYTYPLRSGIYFNGLRKNDVVILFESEAEHVHITQTDDTPCCIGEADFFSDINVINPKIISMDETETLSKKEFDWEKAQKDYYGIDVPEKADYSNFMDILAHYNEDYKPIKL